MLARLRPRRPGHGTVVAYLALFVALGGTTYAAATIGPGDIQDNAVRSNHIKNGEVKTPDLAALSVGTGKLKGGAVTTPKLSDGAVTGTKVAGTLKDAGAGTPSLRSLGLGAQQAMPGNASPSPGGQASGGLAGVYPSPTIGLGAVGPAQIVSHSLGAAQIASHSITADQLFRVHQLKGSDLILVDDPTTAGATNTPLLTSSGATEDLVLIGHCTDNGGGNVTATVAAARGGAGLQSFVASSSAPGGTTRTTSTSVAVTLASFGPTTGAHLGTGAYVVAGPPEPLLTGVVSIGTNVLGKDCLFGANTLG